MRKLSKVICIALSLMLLVNLTGFEAAASEPGTENQADGENKDTATLPDDNADQGDSDNKQDSGDAADVKDDADNTDTVRPDGNGEQPDADAPLDGEDVLDVQEPGQEEDADESEKGLDVQTTAVIKAEPVAGKNQLKISWNKVDGASEYMVYVYEGELLYTSERIDSGDTVECVVDVEPNTKYTIDVDSVNGAASDIGEIPAILLAAPTNLKATASNGTVKLTWSEVADAVYDVVYDGGEKKNLTSASCDITGLTNGKEYTFSVTAHVEYTEKGEKYPYESAAATTSATPIGNKPAQVTGFSGIDGDKSAILTWSKAAYATSYAVDRYNASKKKWETVKTGITQLTYTDSNLTAGKKYQYRVVGMNDNGAGTYSSTITISVKKTPGTKVRSIGYKATVKSRAPLFATSKSSKKLKYLKKGKSVTTIDYASGRYKIKIGGKNYWISKDRLKFRSSIWTTKDYSTKVKEDFVNKKGYKSSSKYLIWISQYTQRVIIYQGSKGKWKMIRNCRCATGTHLHMTPKGKFKVGKKEKGWFYKKTFEKPIVHFKGQNSFHSRIKNYKGGYADATIGRPRSKGCVRLYDEDINFIYKKCPKGTTVISL